MVPSGKAENRNGGLKAKTEEDGEGRIKVNLNLKEPQKYPSSSSPDVVSLESSAKALLKNILTALNDHVQSNVPVQQATVQAFRVRAEGIAKRCLEWNAKKTKAAGTVHMDSALIVVLSDIYESIRKLEEAQHKTGKASGTQQWVAPASFERSTTKYWISEEHLTEVLLACAAEVPLLVYGRSGILTDLSSDNEKYKDKLWNELATPITSVYFDSPDMSLYKERIARHEGAQLLRARWYGNKRPMGDQTIFLELKTHHEKWINTKSLKERADIREKDMPAFLRPVSWTMEDAKAMTKRANAKLSGDALDKAVDRLWRMHKLVCKHKLRACVRSVYLRAAFQASKSNDLRLTVDRNVTLIDETENSSGSWCLSDQDAAAANSYNKATVVPFVVFEVKLAGDDGMPQSLQSLQDQGRIQEATKFSKFLTGAAIYNTNTVSFLPYWAEHPSFAPLFGLSTSGTGGNNTYIQNRQGQNNNNTTARGSVLKKRGSSGSETVKMGEISNSSDSEDYGETKKTMDSSSKPPPKRGFFSLFGRSSKRKTSLPVDPRKFARVEPKSYFANERTFIQWISASLLLVTISVLLLGYENQQNQQQTLQGGSMAAHAAHTSAFARNSGLAVCCAAVLIVIYATFVYFRRIQLLSSGQPYGYVDYIGPMVLGAAVSAGVVILLTEFVMDIKVHLDSQVQFLREEPGACFQHSTEGLRMLEYQPSAIVTDMQRDMLLVASNQQITGHPTSSANGNTNAGVQTLVEIPDSDLEGLTLVGDRIFVLSEGPTNTELIEVSYVDDGSEDTTSNALRIVARWILQEGASQSEGIMYVPSGQQENSNRTAAAGDGRFYIDIDDALRVYRIPPRPEQPVNGNNQVQVQSDESIRISVQPQTDAVSSTMMTLQQVNTLNKGVIEQGLNVDPKIADMIFFEGVAYMLHDNEMLIRSWDIGSGRLLAETPVPHIPNGLSDQWEGFWLERRSVAAGAALLGAQSPSLRGASEGTESMLLLHMALDTPAQVWSFAIQPGNNPGELRFPSCASAKLFVPPMADVPLA